jgi:ZIP family zinc transporter
MTLHTIQAVWTTHRKAHTLAFVTLLAFIPTLAIGLATGREKLVGIVTFGFAAMAGGVAVSLWGTFDTPGRRVWADGLASGAMLASAAALLAPKAITRHAAYGGFAIALGYLLGYAGHELGHLVAHRNLPINAAAGELTLHALAAGSIMGIVYGSLPSLTPLFGYGIVAHKLPAGFTGSEAVKRSGLPPTVMIVPAAAVGISAIPLSVLTPALSPILKATVFGISTGVFSHVAIDMLPECSGGEGGHGSVQCSREADTLRQYAVLSTFLGAGTIFLLWRLLAGP